MKNILKIFCFMILTSCFIFQAEAGNPQHNGPLVGDFYQGGVIFWIDPTKNNQHGLIAAIVDQTGNPATTAGVAWSDVTTTTSALGEGAYQGKNNATACNGGACNTYKILHTPGATYPAASLCANYQGGGYQDWYLPSISELGLLWQNRVAINIASLAQSGGGAMSTANQSRLYWSSTENGLTEAWLINIAGTQLTFPKTGTLAEVRCIRAF